MWSVLGTGDLRVPLLVRQADRAAAAAAVGAATLPLPADVPSPTCAALPNVTRAPAVAASVAPAVLAAPALAPAAPAPAPPPAPAPAPEVAAAAGGPPAEVMSAEACLLVMVAVLLLHPRLRRRAACPPPPPPPLFDRTGAHRPATLEPCDSDSDSSCPSVLLEALTPPASPPALRVVAEVGPPLLPAEVVLVDPGVVRGLSGVSSGGEAADVRSEVRALLEEQEELRRQSMDSWSRVISRADGVGAAEWRRRAEAAEAGQARAKLDLALYQEQFGREEVEAEEKYTRPSWRKYGPEPEHRFGSFRAGRDRRRSVSADGGRRAAAHPPCSPRLEFYALTTPTRPTKRQAQATPQSTRTLSRASP